jgi:DNA polymerase-3 subunit alpha
MLYAVLDDGSSQIEVAIFNELYEQHRQRLKEDQLIIIHGKVSHDDYSGGLRISAESLFDLQLAREERAQALRITLNGNADTARLRQVLNPFRAEPENGVPGVPVEIVLERSGFLCTLRLGQEWRVRMADSLFEQLARWTAPDGVEIRYS